MITICAAILLAQGISIDEARTRAVSFARYAIRHLHDPGSSFQSVDMELMLDVQRIYVDERRPQDYVVHMRGADVWVSKTDGRINSFHGPWGHTRTGPLLRAADAERAINDLTERMGFRSDYVVLDSSEAYEQIEDGAEGTISYLFSRIVDGVKYSTNCTAGRAVLDCRSGTPSSISVTDPPAPPSVTVPSGSAAEATALLLATTMQRRHISVAQMLSGPTLSILVPPKWSRPGEELPPCLANLAAHNRTVLAWEANVESLDELPLSAHELQRRSFMRRFGCGIDALTGETLFVASHDYSGGVKERSFRHVFGWDLGPSDMVLARNKDMARLRMASIGLAKTGAGVSGCPEFLVICGKLAVRCRFDRKSGLLWTVNDGTRSAGRPSRELLAWLRKHS